MTTTLDRLAYATTQTARVGWYMAHCALGRRRLKPMPKPAFEIGPTPDRAALLRDMRALFGREWADIEAGLFPPPPSLVGEPLDWLRRSAAYFRDLPNVDLRRHAGISDEPAHDAAHDHLPRYYRQNFHFQTDGWLSPRSATIYDTQVETLFTGSADLMRRRALKPLAEWLRGRDRRDVAVLDVATGTGRLPAFVAHAFPGLSVTGLDLSLAYLDAARRAHGASRRLKWLEGAAEAIPLPDASVDVATCAFLFHELPRKIRGQVAAEMARVLKPGGRAIVVDSIVETDRPDWKGLLDLFPHHFHEPYYADWVRSDPDAPLVAAGLVPAGTEIAFLSRAMVFDKSAT